jgi:hypothetical protein
VKGRLHSPIEIETAWKLQGIPSAQNCLRVGRVVAVSPESLTHCLTTRQGIHGGRKDWMSRSPISGTR